VLRDVLRRAGAAVQHPGPGQQIPFGTPDEIWLTHAGQAQWIVLTRDQRIRRRALEREALKRHGIAAFVFVGGEVSAATTAAVIVPLLPKFANMSVSEPRPFLYTFSSRGRLARARL
jgi:hypothetical protein